PVDFVVSFFALLAVGFELFLFAFVELLFLADFSAFAFFPSDLSVVEPASLLDVALPVEEETSSVSDFSFSELSSSEFFPTSSSSDASSSVMATSPSLPESSNPVGFSNEDPQALKLNTI